MAQFDRVVTFVEMADHSEYAEAVDGATTAKTNANKMPAGNRYLMPNPLSITGVVNEINT